MNFLFFFLPKKGTMMKNITRLPSLDQLERFSGCGRLASDIVWQCTRYAWALFGIVRILGFDADEFSGRAPTSKNAIKTGLWVVHFEWRSEPVRSLGWWVDIFFFCSCCWVNEWWDLFTNSLAVLDWTFCSRMRNVHTLSDNCVSNKSVMIRPRYRRWQCWFTEK